MNKNTLIFLVALFGTLLVNAQEGNTIGEAILTDGIDIPLNILNFNTATVSGEPASCGDITEEDVFYMHPISPSINKLAIELKTSLIALSTSFEYQILLAPNGDTGNLQEIECDTYSVSILGGGNLQKEVINVTPNDAYYFRIRKRSDLLGIELTTLINSTTITMDSSFDPSLSVENLNIDQIKIISDKHSLKLIGNDDYNHYKIFTINGQLVLENTGDQPLSIIDVSRLDKGIYILNLNNGDGKLMFKFIKQ